MTSAREPTETFVTKEWSIPSLNMNLVDALETYKFV